MRWSLVLIAASACYSPAAEPDCVLQCSGEGSCPANLRCGTSGLCSARNTCSGDTPDLDGGTDGNVDASVGCYGGRSDGGFLQICTVDADPGTVTLMGTINTDVAEMCSAYLPQAGGIELCVIRAKGNILVNTVTATGTRPLVLVAQRILVGGVLDVSSGGAGSISILSGFESGGGLDDSGTQSGGGGAGGSFAGQGGNGGDTNGSGGPALGGRPNMALPFPMVVVGGRIGGLGGLGGVGNANGGLGGGAVYLAAEIITMAGIIDAGGGGGIGGSARGGGSGGGSGGLIILDAPTVTLGSGGTLIATGGAGAGGASAIAIGQNGGDPDTTAMTTGGVTAQGGISGSAAGNGGDGSSITSDNGERGVTGSINNVGGGGGGGGHGFIRIYTSALTIPNSSVIVPALSVP